MNNIASINSWNTVLLQRDDGKRPDICALTSLPKQSLNEISHLCVVNQNSVIR